MTSTLRGRERGWQKSDNSTDRLREWDSDKGGRGFKNPNIMRTSFKYGPLQSVSSAHVGLVCVYNVMNSPTTVT